MSDDPLKAMEAQRARLREELEAMERDMAEIARLRLIAAKYNLVVASPEVPHAEPKEAPALSVLAVPVGPVPAQVPAQPPAPAPASLGLVPASGNPVTMSDLLYRYRTDQRSPYLTVRHVTKRGYDRLIARIEKDCGPSRLAHLNEQGINELYRRWTEGGKKQPMGHGLITMLRMIFGFGALKLEDSECVRLSVVLRRMSFSPPKGRAARKLEPMTEDYARAIIRKSNEIGRPSIGLAQVLQFCCRLYQKDVIGEWVPLHDGEPSDFVVGSEKWIRGICWEHIDSNMILRHVTSTDRKSIEIDLRRHTLVMAQLPLVIADLERRGKAPPKGPLIADEDTGHAYQTWKFRRLWRRFATFAKVPKNVWNMDSRSNASGNGESKTAVSSSRERELASTARH